MEINKKFLLTTLVMTALVMLVIPSVSAASGLGGGTVHKALTSPVIGNNYTGTATFTVNNTWLPGRYNVTWYCNTSGGAAYNSTNMGMTSNTTAGQNITTGSFAITAVDTLTANCTARIDNASAAGQIWVTTAAMVTFDSTAPICTIDALKNKIEYKGKIDVTWSITDALHLETSHATIDGPGLQTLIIDTDAVETRTLTSQETKYLGDWIVNASGVDDAGNVCTLSSDTFSTIPSDYYEEEPDAEPLAGKGLLIIVAIVVVYLVFFRKK